MVVRKRIGGENIYLPIRNPHSKHSKMGLHNEICHLSFLQKHYEIITF